MTKSIFIARPKKPGATDCELHQTISLMSHMTKILMRIVMKRTKNMIRPEIGEEQCGFVQDAGTRNAIFTIRLLAERALEMQKDIFICLIDFAKALD